MIPPASRRDKTLALGPVVVAHGLAAWLLVAGSPDTTAPSGGPDPVISIELFDARTTAPDPAPAAAAVSATATADTLPQTLPIRPASLSNAVDRLLPFEPEAVSPAVQSQPSTTLSTSSSPYARTSVDATVTRRDGPSTTSRGDAAPVGKTADRYPAQVLAWIERHKRYPPRASDRRLAGEAVVALTLDRRGRLRRVELIQSSGHPLLDEAAIDAVQRADPFPRPETGGWTRRRFEVPLRFRPAQP